MGSLKQLVFLLGVSLFSIPVWGQTVTLAEKANLYERPDATSMVKMALPAGIELTILSEQGQWKAVSTSTGIVGWIQKPSEEAGKSDELDDLLRSIDEASQDD